LSNAHETLVRLLLPKGLLDYFDLTNVAQTPAGLNIYLEEKNLPPSGYEKAQLE
jgi:hypothetical protein